MGRWYQNVLSGKQVEVSNFDEEDFYLENKANWERIVAPTPSPQKLAAEPTHAKKPAAKKKG